MLVVSTANDHVYGILVRQEGDLVLYQGNGRTGVLPKSMVYLVPVAS